LELAFDATTGAYLTYVDKAMKLLDQRRAEGLALGGWFSLRFVGPSRAIMSPQQSGRTCMIEFVGLRSMNGQFQSPAVRQQPPLSKRARHKDKG
jgi:hypothetical protein